MTKLTEEDKALFAEATEGVTSVNRKVIVAKNKPNTRAKIKFSKKQKLNRTENIDRFFLNERIAPVSAHESLFYQQPSIRKQDIIKLKKGFFPIEITEDLHGKTESIAENSIHSFIQEAIEHQCKYGLIIHGKGYNSNSEQPILKNLVNQLLTGHSNILAFCSAQQKDGGTGAVYILFKTK